MSYEPGVVHLYYKTLLLPNDDDNVVPVETGTLDGLSLGQFQVPPLFANCWCGAGHPPTVHRQIEALADREFIALQRPLNLAHALPLPKVELHRPEDVVPLHPRNRQVDDISLVVRASKMLSFPPSHQPLGIHRPIGHIRLRALAGRDQQDRSKARNQQVAAREGEGGNVTTSSHWVDCKGLDQKLSNAKEPAEGLETALAARWLPVDAGTRERVAPPCQSLDSREQLGWTAFKRQRPMLWASDLDWRRLT